VNQYQFESSKTVGWSMKLTDQEFLNIMRIIDTPRERITRSDIVDSNLSE
jgi:hypothetical protein